MPAPQTVQLAADMPSNSAQLIVAAVAGIGVLVVLVTVFKLHPLISLTLGALTVGVVAGENLNDTVESFSAGVGETVAGVGLLIVFGAIVGRLLVDSSGADQIVDTIVGRASDRMLPWAMALVGALIGLPMFFEIGLVLLIPVIVLVARRSGQPMMRVGIPALAGLSVMHGLVPPHPGPLLAIDAVGADLGQTLALGLVVAIPTVVIAGPVFSRFAAQWVPVGPPTMFDKSEDEPQAPHRPSFGATLFTVLLPVALMLGKAIADIVIDDENNTTQIVLDFVGTPMIALLVAVLVSFFTLGRGSGMTTQEIGESVEKAFGPIAGITFIVAAGGGFKQVLVDSGIADVIKDAVEGSDVSPLLLAWVVAVLIRLATGSATVATITTAGIMESVAADLTQSHTALLVLAIGAGSLFFSHVNDAGFWLVKEYFGLTVGQNIKTWSVMETIISVCGIVFVLLLALLI